jgi:hypothetical protein
MIVQAKAAEKGFRVFPAHDVLATLAEKDEVFREKGMLQEKEPLRFHDLRFHPGGRRVKQSCEKKPH